MPVRLIAIDIDGTLLDSRGSLPEVNRSAVQQAVGRGVQVVLVTGRSFHFARPVAETLPDSVMLIVSNGALIKMKDGKTRSRRLLPRPIAHQVLDSTTAFRRHAALIFDRVGGDQVICERMDWSHPNRRRYYERNRECIAEATPLESALIEDPIQVMFNGGVTEMRELLEAFKQLPVSAEIEIALTEYEHRDFSLLDVMTRGCSKGSALAKWTAACGLTRSEVMAIGDNFNDREMLEFAGLPVVMGNAVPGLKASHWTYTDSNDEGGVAKAIAAHVLADPP